MKKISNKNYLEWLRRQSCALCGSPEDVQAHHVGGDFTRTRRGNDENAICLCFIHHRAAHCHPELYRDRLRELAVKYWKDYQGAKMKTFISVTDSFSLKSSKIPPLRPVTWRKCHKCGKKKEIRLFPRQLRCGTSGHGNICLACMREFQK